MKKIIAIFLIAALSLCTIAEEIPNEEPVIVEETAAEEEIVEVVVTPAPTPEPTPEVTPEPTVEPTANPEPEVVVESTPEVTPVPEATETPIEVINEELSTEQEAEEPREESDAESIADDETETPEVSEDASDVQVIEVISEVITINEEAEEVPEADEDVSEIAEEITADDAGEQAESKTPDEEKREEEVSPEPADQEVSEDSIEEDETIGDGKVSEESEEEIPVDEPIFAAPMMVGLSFMGAKASNPETIDVTPDKSRGKNEYGGYDYTVSGYAYYDDDARRFGFYYGDKYLVTTSDGSPIRTVLYADDANNQTSLIFVPLIKDTKVEFTFKVNSKTLSSQGYISALFNDKATFSITYAEIYKALTNGSSTVSIHCRTNGSAIYNWGYKAGGDYGWQMVGYKWIKQDVDQSWTFTKYTYNKPTPTISIKADKTEVYPGDNVVISIANASAYTTTDSNNLTSDKYTVSYLISSDGGNTWSDWNGQPMTYTVTKTTTFAAKMIVSWSDNL